MPKLWYFEWLGGGYNSVHAENKRAAIAAAKQLGKPSMSMTVTLVPNKDTFTTDPKKQQAIEARWFMD